MLPHKAKDFIKLTAEKVGYSETIVEDVTSFYWETVRKTLSNPKSISITIADFGTFTIKPWKLKQFIDKFEGMMKSIELNTFKKYASLKNYQKRKVIVDDLTQQFKDLEVGKQRVINGIYHKKYGKRTNSSLEK